MAIPVIQEYLYYRLTFTGSTSVKDPEADKYITINTLKFFELDVGGTDFASTGIATSSGIYGSQSPDLTIDGNDATYWESSSTAKPWLKIQLPEPKAVRRFVLISTAVYSEIPEDFIIEGSNDDIEWSTLANVKNCPQPVGGAIIASNKIITGTSLTEDGEPTLKVEFYNWVTGELVSTITPDANGAYLFREYSDIEVSYLVVHKGALGYKPQADGPVYALVYQ